MEFIKVLTEDLWTKKEYKKNLTFISKKMGIKRSNLILMYQTHSNKVIEVKKINLEEK